MKVRELLPADIEPCVELLMAAYNPPPWNDHWTEETGFRYLSDFAESRRFIGYVIVESDEIVGALFGHRKTWWTNDEIFVDELFIRPDRQRLGYGKMLMDRVEALSRELGLGGVTLLTNKYHPAKLFYEKNDYTVAEHVVFMYKEVAAPAPKTHPL
ncbi:MAG: GNAT family N-acetyltransferase [Anaerolineales bacterium]|nr:GNAT family N-acetyltransferase [Anaerolineales bacterium]